jgi:hypothetical protein
MGEAVSLPHAERLIESCEKLPSDQERIWYYEWALTIKRLAQALEDAGVPRPMVEQIALGSTPTDL